MRSCPAIPAETNDSTLDQGVLPDAHKEKRHREMTSTRKATLDRLRQNAKGVRDQIKISNESPIYFEEPQSVKPDVDTPIYIEEFNTEFEINTDIPKKHMPRRASIFISWI